MIEPLTTLCALCGRKRYSGWVLEREDFRVPVCSACLMRTGRLIDPLQFDPTVAVSLTIGGEVWTVKKEESADAGRQ